MPTEFVRWDECPLSSTRYTLPMSEVALARVLARTVWLVTGVWLVLWFFNSITLVMLFFLVAMVLAFALNPPITWLEDHRTPRVLGTLITLLGITMVFGLLTWLIIPVLYEQFAMLITSLPSYATQLLDRLSGLLAKYPALQDRIRLDASVLGRALPGIQSFVGRIGRSTVDFLAFFILLLATLSMAVYVAMNPRPILRGLLISLPPLYREPTTRALVKSSRMVSAWISSNVIVGSLEAFAAALFLSWIGIPGALLWGAFTFFAELIPKISTYIMPIPALLVALAVDPIKALWVLLFYMALNEVTGDFVAPFVRGTQMDLHPALLIVFVLAMAVAFGFVGALMSTPLTGIAKAFYEEFYLARQLPDQDLEQRVERILGRRGE